MWAWGTSNVPRESERLLVEFIWMEMSTGAEKSFQNMTNTPGPIDLWPLMQHKTLRLAIFRESNIINIREHPEEKPQSILEY